MDLKVEAKEFDTAAGFLEPKLRKILLSLDLNDKNNTYEIRIRAENFIVLVTKNGNKFLCSDGTLSDSVGETSVKAATEAVTQTFNRLCSYSVHSYLSGIVKGYITVKGGHRAGIAGTAVTDSKGDITSIRDVSGINLRISREIKGSADKILKSIFSAGSESVIIAGPPSSGKTTVLRDLVRQLSSEGKLYKIALIDERREIASINAGIAENDVGINTDVLDGYPKDRGIITALKTLSPDIIAVDEVAENNEIKSIASGVNSGVRFIVTVHAKNYNELLYRQQIFELLGTYSFEKLVMLKKSPVGEISEIYDAKELRDEIIRCRHNLDFNDSFGNDGILVS